MQRVYVVCLAHLYLFDCNATGASASNFYFYFFNPSFPFTSITLFITDVPLVCMCSSFGLVYECGAKIASHGFIVAWFLFFLIF
jgi:hypothetical protein